MNAEDVLNRWSDIEEDSETDYSESEHEDSENEDEDEGLVSESWREISGKL